ncbi:hypothetical protein [Nocardia sp. NPDC052316]|uniref:hypothetical protein n=1 Tax=Nocardia sp. NPDC052316 TaxID=3364329 RepID=UPI0037C530C9
MGAYKAAERGIAVRRYERRDRRWNSEYQCYSPVVGNFPSTSAGSADQSGADRAEG